MLQEYGGLKGWGVFRHGLLGCPSHSHVVLPVGTPP